MIRHFVSKSPLSLSNQQRTSLGVLLHTTTTTTSTTINHHHHHYQQQQQQQQQERSFHSLSTSHSFHQSPVSLHQYTTKNNHNNNKSNNKNNNQNVSNNSNNNNNNNNAASGGKSKKAMNTKASLAQRLFEEKKWNESIDLFNQVLSVDPDHPVALVGRAKIHTLMGRYSEALIDSQKAHSVDTSFALLNDMFVIHAGLLLRLAKYDDLLFYGNQMSDHAKKAQHPYFLASCLRFMAIAVIKRLMQKGDYASALDFIDQRVLAGLDNFNEVHELFHLKSQLLLRMDKFDEAAEVAQRYLKHDQNEGTECPVTTFYHIYAQTSHYQGEKALAKEILGLWGQMIEEDYATQSFEYQCFRVEYQYTKAKIYAMQGHISSLDMYKTVLNNAKQEQHFDFIPDILVDMALAKNLFGLKDEAKKDLQEALTYVPAHAVYSQINL